MDAVVLSGKVVFDLQSTYGLPLSVLITEIYQRRVEIDGQSYPIVVDWSDWAMECLNFGRSMRKIRGDLLGAISDADLVDRETKNQMKQIAERFMDALDILDAKHE